MLIQRNKKGFTLIELLVVMGVIAILMSLLVPVIGKIRATVNKNRVSMLINGMGMALEAYKNSYGSYPPDRHPSLATAGAAGISSESLVFFLSGGSIVYVPGSSPASYPWRHSIYTDTSPDETGRKAYPIFYDFKTSTLIDKNGNLAPEIIDPWGKRLVYNSGNTKNYNSSPANLYNQYEQPRHGIKKFDIFSAGIDGIYGNSDDIRSWGDSPALASDYTYSIFNSPNAEP